MQHVVTADEPLAMLIQELCAGYEEGKLSHVAATAEVLLDHPSDAIDVTPTMRWADSAPLDLAIVGEDRDGYLPVLLPEWGKGWVPNDTPTRIRTTASAQRFCPPSRLIVEPTEETDATVALVRLLGHGLKHVLLQGCSSVDTPINDFCMHVLAASPQLEHLELQNVRFDSLLFVLDAVDARQCPALTRLTFFSIEIQSALAVDVFLQSLATPGSKSANQLRFLSLEVTQCPGTDRDTLLLANEMLQHNTRLHQVVIKLPPNNSITTEEEVEAAENQVGFVRLRDELAFLSVGAAGRETPGKNSAFQRFNGLVLSRILGFASTWHVRSVKIYGG